MSAVALVECPEHGGNFDCTPFCPGCAGEQEVPVSGSKDRIDRQIADRGMKTYRLTLWYTHGDSAGALVVEEVASSPGRAIDSALTRVGLAPHAVIGWEQVTKYDTKGKLK